MEKIRNFGQYFGVRSASYYHAETKANYDANDFLAYYLDKSDRADYPGPRDSDDIPLYTSGNRTDYLPVLTCLIALGHLERYRRTERTDDHAYFLKLADHIAETQDGEGLWLTPLPMRKFNLYDNWPSAMVQGLAISVLTRATKLTDNGVYIEHAKRALAPFQKTIEQGGVCGKYRDQIVYEEYPSRPTHHVLNGFIYALWGLYDLKRLTDGSETASLYESGVESLIELLPEFDTGYWSLYGIGEGPTNPATIPYHKIHIEQLKVTAELTGSGEIRKYAARWDKYLLGRFNALRTLPAKISWNLTKGF